MKKWVLIILTILISAFAEGQDLVKTKQVKSKGHNGEAFKSFAFDGAWCWFADPRAVYYEGQHKRTYSGWIDSNGDVLVGYYDHETGEVATNVLFDNLQIDDHDNPSLLFDKDGHLKVFYSKHASPFPIQMERAKNPEDISSWEERKELALNDMGKYEGLRDDYTYPNPAYLSAEDKLYMFWRGADFKPNYAVSADGGETWSEGMIFVLPEREYENRRPYMKVYDNGLDKIHFAFTDGHPRNEKTNSIYYMYYKDGAFYKVDGTKIRDIDEVGENPVEPWEASEVYDAKPEGNPKSWIWDLAEDAEGNPVLAYAKFPDDQNHIYAYAFWEKGDWKKIDLVNSGDWMPETPEGKTEPEPNYSGGIAIDHEDPSVLYLSVKRDSIFEIEKWSTRNKGKKWNIEAITKGSSKDNIRPFPVRNAGEGNPLQVVWMSNTHYRHYTDYHSSLKMGVEPDPATTAFDSASIVGLMHQVADWQLENPREFHILDWHYGAFYTGLMGLYETTKENRYLNEMINIGQKYDWKLLNDIYHADRLTIAQVFADLYKIEQDPKMLEKVQWVMDMHVDRKPEADVTFDNNPYHLEWWTWCDALYMAPPAFAKVYEATGDNKYLDYLDKHWWKTSDYLYSSQDSLYYRDDRFFDKRSENDQKVFWGRGNGWVIAGLARVIPYLPEDYPNRVKYEKQFQEMAYKLLSIQGNDGMWRASLLDPEELPIGESSATAFFTYALSWGINNNLLAREEFELPVMEAWKALVNNVNDQGRLGYVQQVAGSPYPFYEDESHVYASGAFLLAGKEMIKLLETNPLVKK